MRCAIGIDFGTESVRSVLVDVDTGETVATSVFQFPDGVIDMRLPGGHAALPPDWALQNPADWLAGLDATVRAVMASSSLPPESVIGIGIDFTSCRPPATARRCASSHRCAASRTPGRSSGNITPRNPTPIA
jgi:ribulose kinase